MKSKKDLNFNAPGLRYYHLWDTHANTNGIPNRVGKVFPDLKMIVFDDQELVAMLDYRSNRRYTLPSPKLGLSSHDGLATQSMISTTGQTVWAPASTYIPGVYAFTDASSDPWFAPAGLIRGALGSVIRAERKLTSGNRDTLYEANVNPIATFPGTGTVVYGQKTLQTVSSALDRVNVRRLLIALKSYISQVANNLVFEQNTIATRNQFLSQVNPYLESVQQRQGLYAFRVIMDDSNNTPDVIDRNQMVGQIYLQPTKTAEFIYLDFNILPTGATFPG
jgi:phage tail sheath protein FI